MQISSLQKMEILAYNTQNMTNINYLIIYSSSLLLPAGHHFSISNTIYVMIVLIKKLINIHWWGTLTKGGGGGDLNSCKISILPYEKDTREKHRLLRREEVSESLPLGGVHLYAGSSPHSLQSWSLTFPHNDSSNTSIILQIPFTRLSSIRSSTLFSHEPCWSLRSSWFSPSSIGGCNDQLVYSGRHYATYCLTIGPDVIPYTVLTHRTRHSRHQNPRRVLKPEKKPVDMRTRS